jgi:acyl-coenzyme A thioesterase PaaI-like protein
VSNTEAPRHSLDQAVALRALTGDAQPLRRYAGQTHPAYDNMVGPWGGVTAAQAMAAVLNHPLLLGEPVAFTGNYVAALANGPFEAEAEPVRTNRSTQHWVVRMTQTGADGVSAVVFTATVVTAVRRQTWSAHDVPMPLDIPAPETIERPAQNPKRVTFGSCYESRPILGTPPREWDGSEADSRTLQWMRDLPPRPLDFLSLTAMSDLFYPRVWRRRAHRTPAGTVSITIYYHARAADLAAAGTDYLLGQAVGQSFYHGFHDQSACIWRRDGHLLVTTHQAVYYKE